MAHLIDELVAASPNRRSFLKTLATATAGVSALSMAGLTPAQGQTTTEIEVLQFALNLEYLEAEFYTHVVESKPIEAFGIGIDGLANGANPTSGGTTQGQYGLYFNNAFQFLTFQVAADIANDERQHVSLLRSALGAQAIAKPNINLNALGFGFGSQYEFIKLARIFEDIGVSAYAGGAGLLTTASVITTAARILAAESEHASALRMQAALLNVQTAPPLDGADLLPPPTGTDFQIFSLNRENGLCATRTPGEVLYLAFGNKENATSGGFFPTGVNGAITTSSGPATASNLAT
jgi:Ferritin-like domain